MQQTIKIFVMVSLLILTSCASFYKQTNTGVAQELSKPTSELSHTFYLIGDAGNAFLNETTPALNSLQKRLSAADENSTVLFLGDNIYPEGMPKKDSPAYALAEHRIQVQIDIVKNFTGNTIFIPGNHDWYSNGIKGLKRQEKYIGKALGDGAFLPEDGCAFKRVKISKEVVLLIVDSQWFLEDWDKNPTINDDCDIRTRTDFFDEFESEIKKNREKTTLIAIHHPLFTDGPHGGNFSAKQHLYPNNRLPLPGLGSLANFIRKTGGVSAQDTQNKNYRYLVNRLSTLAQESDRVIFASGHEHSLQYIEKDNIVQIVSGAGAKTSGVKKSAASDFAFSTLGYAVLKIFKDGTSQVEFIKCDNEGDEIVFQKEIFPSASYNMTESFKTDHKAITKAAVYKPETTEKNAFYRSLWGKHYREEYGELIEAPTVKLDTLYGGLTPIKRGGGNQSVSLRLVDKDGKQWVMRALKKSAVQFLQINAYQEKYIKEDLKNTYLETLLNDFYTVSHPYVSFVIPDLSKEIGVYHTNPKLFYIPKQAALKQYNADHGDALYMIEEHVGDTQISNESFGAPEDIISSLDLFKKLRKNPKHRIDEKAYARARIFDMIIGDWDRHEDQWRWSKFKDGDGFIYRPIPRDRDQAFSNFDGPLIGFITRIVPALRKMQTYDPKIRNLKWHNTNGMPVDNLLLRSLTLEDWLKEVEFIQEQLTDSKIDAAFKNFPKEVQNENTEKLREILIYRRNNAATIASAYYKLLQKCVILRASDKKDVIQITRHPDGETQVTFTYKGSVYFDARYRKEFTKELWLYALDDEDQITVSGDSNAEIKVRIIGGQNNDIYTIENGKKVQIYDYKSKKNTLGNTADAKVTLTDEYHTNTYDFYKKKDVVNQLTPLLGANPDDGFFFGLKESITVNKFRQNPFSQKHQLKAAYYITNNGYDLGYNGKFANIINDWNITLGTRYTSPNFATNFFGFGNETENFDDNLDRDYNRVKMAHLSGEIGIAHTGNEGSEFQVKGVFESIRVENTPDRFIGSFPPNASFFDRNNFAGAEVMYQFKNYNDIVFPTLGMDFNITGGWKTNTADTDRDFGYLIPSFSFITKLTKNERLVLVNKTEAHLTFGDQFEFYQAASIGGNNGLRGFRHQRFTGKNSFYNSTDIRLNFRKLKSGFAPMNLGFYGGLDLGRVWIDNDNSKQWHNSIGGGLWLSLAEFITGQAGAFSSSDGVRIAFGLGFGI